MGQELGLRERPPRHRARRVAGGVIASAFLFAALLYPLLVPGTPANTGSQGQATSTARADNDAAQDRDPSEPAGPGIVMVISPSLSGDLQVTETVRLADPTDTLVVGPPKVSRAGSQFDDVMATASAVRLRSPNQVLSFPQGPVDGRTRVPVPSTATAEISYRLTGATVRSAPSRPGRASGVISPLLRGLDDDLPVHVVVTGPTVLNLACPLLPAAEQACRDGSALAAQTDSPLPFSDAVVTVQLDLRRT